MMFMRSHLVCVICDVIIAVCLFSFSALAMPQIDYRPKMELTLEPLESIVFAGDDVAFTCSYSQNVSFNWDYNDAIRPDAMRPDSIVEGVTILNDTANERTIFWSRLSLRSVKRPMSGEIICSIHNSSHPPVVGFLIVNGVKIGGRCTSNEDCITDKATCQRGTCLCPKNDVLLRLTENGYEVCRKMSYRLYDPCQFSEECFHLVDSKSVCAKNHICVCASWAVDVDGKCVSKSEMNYNKNQELYRVGLVAITCLIIIIVAISLWITLRKSCIQRTSGSQRSYAGNPDSEQGNDPPIEDKPPSYDDALEATDTVASPPTFKDALINNMTAKRLLRQVSAPAGQLLSRATSFDPTKKTNTTNNGGTQNAKPKS